MKKEETNIKMLHAYLSSDAAGYLLSGILDLLNVCFTNVLVKKDENTYIYRAELFTKPDGKLFKKSITISSEMIIDKDINLSDDYYKNIQDKKEKLYKDLSNKLFEAVAK